MTNLEDIQNTILDNAVPPAVPAFVAAADYENAIAERDLARTAVDSWRNSYNTVNSNYKSFRETVTGWVKDNINSSYLNSDSVKELAEECGIELTQDVAWTVTVTYLCSATVDLSVDLDDLAGEMNGCFNGELTMDSFDGIDNFDAQADSYDVDDVEVS